MIAIQCLLFLIILTVNALCQQLGPYVEILRKSRDTNWKMDEILPTNYNYLIAPVVNNTPIDVEVVVSILSFRSIKEKSLSFAVDVFFHQYWSDNRLRVPTGLEVNTKLRLNNNWKDKLWTPDTYFCNAIDGSVNNILDPIIYFTIENQTKVLMAIKLTLEFSCDMDFAKYPFDTQMCNFELSSLSNTIEILRYKWRRFHVTKHIYLPQFVITNVSVENCVKTYEDIGTYSCLRGSLTMKRNVSNFIIKHYIPSLFIVILTFVSFWIPTTAYPARVGLTITALLALTVQQTQDLNVSVINALSVWMFVCITFVFSTLIEFVFAIRLLQNKLHITVNNECNDNDNDSDDTHNPINNHKTSITKLLNSCIM
ncbi:glycine receptor subunit beta-like [Oppia nitens]|uniref:glycine receptor subunit beta-like n=1 Tax=Oppia nitens TaxID=1686743 RepID=UPI0023DA22EE|nr:glycine receptor subunit beta-like [Oppia nitens]